MMMTKPAVMREGDGELTLIVQKRTIIQNDHNPKKTEEPSKGGQLYKIFQRLENNSNYEKCSGDSTVTLPHNRNKVKQLKEKLSPKLYRSLRLHSSNSSISSVLSKSSVGQSSNFETPTEEKPNFCYPSKPPLKKKPVIDPSKLEEHRKRFSKASKKSSAGYHSDSNDSGSFEIICESLKDVSLSSERTNGITDSELGYEGENKVDCPSAVNKVIQDVEESDKKKYGRKLKNSIEELIQSEERYVDSMKHIVDNYIGPVENYRGKFGSKLLKGDIFSNIEDIYYLHSTKILPEFRKHSKNLRKLARIFIDSEILFEAYITYLCNKNNSNKIIHDNLIFFEDIRKRLGSCLNLSSFMLTPVQRLPRYILFLEEFLKCYKTIVSDLEEVSSINSKNSSIYWDSDDSENEPKESIVANLETAIISVQNILKMSDTCMILKSVYDIPAFLYTGSLSHHDEFTVTDSQSKKTWFMRCFLFEQLLLLTKVEIKSGFGEIYHYHDFIETSKLGITPPENEHAEKFCVWSEKMMNKNYALHASSGIVYKWVEYIRSLLLKEAMSIRQNSRPLKIIHQLPKTINPVDQCLRASQKSTLSRKSQRKKKVNKTTNDVVRFVGQNCNVLWTPPQIYTNQTHL